MLQYSEESKGNLPSPLKCSFGCEIAEMEGSTVNMTSKPGSLKGLSLRGGKEQEKNLPTSAFQLSEQGIAQVYSMGNQEWPTL